MSDVKWEDLDQIQRGLWLIQHHEHTPKDKWDEQSCRCDPSVGMAPCEYCQLYDSLKFALLLQQQNEQLHAEVERLRNALRECGLHIAACAKDMSRMPFDCDCGWSEWQDELKIEEGEG